MPCRTSSSLFQTAKLAKSLVRGYDLMREDGLPLQDAQTFDELRKICADIEKRAVATSGAA